MQLLNLFAVASGPGNLFHTDWVAFPEDYGRLEFWVEAKTFEGGQIEIELQSGMDMDENAAQTLATANVNATGTTVQAVGVSLGAWMRLEISTMVALARAVLSVWVVAKRK
jgi:hypothetical protein